MVFIYPEIDSCVTMDAWKSDEFGHSVYSRTFSYGKLLVYTGRIVMAMSPKGFYTWVMDVFSPWKQQQPRSGDGFHIYPTLRFESEQFLFKVVLQGFLHMHSYLSCDELANSYTVKVTFWFKYFYLLDGMYKQNISLLERENFAPMEFFALPGSVTSKVPHLCSPCLFTFGRGLLLHLNLKWCKVDSYSGIAKVPSMMYINMENKALGLLAWHILLL